MTALTKQVGGSHYKAFAIQPVEFIEANGLTFLEGCIVKRICRWRTKNGIEDLEKIKHEIDLLIELEHAKDSKRQRQAEIEAQKSCGQRPGDVILVSPEDYLRRFI